MPDFDDVMPDLELFADTGLVPTLKTVLFPNDGTLSFKEAFLDVLGSGLFAVREAVAQGVASERGSDNALGSNIVVPDDFDFDLDPDQGG